MSKSNKITEVEEICAGRLAHQVAVEIELRDVASQTPAQFYLGSSIRSTIVRVMIGFAALFLFLQYADSVWNRLWILFVVFAVVEIARINRRINALDKLLRLHVGRQSGLAGNKNIEEDE